jgi:hypothetical protein
MVFSPLALVAAQSAPSPTTPLIKPSRGGDRQQDDVCGSGDVTVMQPVSVLTWPWSTMVETGDVMDWWMKLEGEESCI